MENKEITLFHFQPTRKLRSEVAKLNVYVVNEKHKPLILTVDKTKYQVVSIDGNSGHVFTIRQDGTNFIKEFAICYLIRSQLIAILKNVKINDTNWRLIM